MQDLVIIKTFVQRLEAEVAQSALEANGIASQIQADDRGGATPYPFQPSASWVKLLVSKKDLADARKILNVKASE